MAQIVNLVATTELEAVNAMLASIGEAPIANLDAATATDVLMAINILRNTAREVQMLGWRFNSEFGLQIKSSGSYVRLDTDGVMTELSIFKPPAGLASFEITRSEDQQGSKYADAVIRPSKEYTEGAPPLPVMVFYDRERNRDGWDATERVYLYIDAVFLFNFEQLPESARWYITVRAARRFGQDVAGSVELSRFKERDELQALRSLKRDQGENDDYNILDNMDVYKVLGRPRGVSGIFDPRNTPGPA